MLNLFQPPAGLLGDQEEAIRQQMQTQGLLGLAAGLFQAGTPSRTPQSLGGSALQGLMAGQQMANETYMNALKMQEYARQRQEQERVSKARQQFESQLQAATKTVPSLGITSGGQQANMLAQQMQGFAPEDLAGTQQALMSAGATQQVTDQAAADRAVMDYLRVAAPTEYAKLMVKEPKETFKLLSPSEAKSLGLPPENGYQVSSSGKISQIGSGPLVKNIVGGQSGLDNEMKIRDAFKGEPVYKAYNEMQSAYSQITESLKQASPAGDLAGATKFMKLLDPGSVVRESELFMAMQASGALDRFTNYANNVLKGTKLTPTQRIDFQNLADKLYSASVQAYNKKRGEYAGFAQEYGLNPDRATGPAAKFSKNIVVDY